MRCQVNSRGVSQVEEDPARLRVAAQLFANVENDTAVHTVGCVGRPETVLRVGPDDFRDVATDRCQVFSAATRGPGHAHALWEVVDLGNSAVGLRSLATGKFLKVVAPKPDDWNAPWKVAVVASLPGLAERFQLSGGKLYSELMHGYLQCGGGGLAEPLKGFPGDTLYEESEAYHFALSRVPAEDLAKASGALLLYYSGINSRKKRLFRYHILCSASSVIIAHTACGLLRP